MAKKDKNVKTKDTKPKDVKPEEVKSEDVKPEDVKSEEVKSEDVKPEEVKSEDVKPEDKGYLEPIHPVAFDVHLMPHHPQDSYGRCGYRFNKENVVRISADELTGEQISRLFEDPYLEVVPVIEED
ncbi:hypothetical protein NM952_11035 [Pasteurella multocida subsp. multocida]|uniref:Uncharacterized protein n=1 Tax=Pasteurella multocida TaxID=747 RepID=A0A9X3URI2_PASMD|nr:hypothetical protein [Pasteurella multocida]MBF6981444.1 hypothetical protein [Pasteurella multocida]MDA5619125.1 hypothetical protein [Pasteurella multocida subsp. multocida]MDA5621605.1 hypothetical protein [Pasteurella multocida subsp. multocida]MDA5624053.1 hypothetical protein [Pasteurella multocida]